MCLSADHLLHFALFTASSRLQALHPRQVDGPLLGTHAEDGEPGDWFFFVLPHAQPPTPDVKITRPEERRDLSRIDISMPIREEGDIPYYIPYQKINEYGKKEEALIMVSLKGRRQRCYHCHSTEPWPNQCTKKMSQKTERTLGRRAEPAPGNVVTGISYARMAGTRRAAPQSSPPQATKAPPDATAPQAKPATKSPPAEKSAPSKKKGSPDKPSPPPKPARDSPASTTPAGKETGKKEDPGQLVPILKKVADQAIKRGRLPQEMKLSYITLLPKNPNNRTEVSKYRSVRQGCSMSPLLYTLILEPLLESIRQDKEIGGIKIPGGGEQKSKAFADDTMMLTAKDSSITKIIQKFEDFGAASGNKINIAKTSIMNVGTDNNRPNPPFNLKVVTEMKIYGLHFSNQKEQTTIKSWDDLLGKCEKQVKAYENKQTNNIRKSKNSK
ncbi:hypothetical protein RRG08_031848 [Elysia crispata]|uniref:Reverse transcriptase domain-containing protein n=1 Tax=Elysia crispata TaxID=231223 RepID=A0AAE0Y5P4_9GAST|nr:hypothetical protein RRG08_031848 [Elysia crispata]